MNCLPKPYEFRRRPATRIRPHEWRCQSAVYQTRRRGFSLIELLVVITIVLVLAAVTVASFNFSANADRVRSGARQVQSLLIGARDKAIYAKEIRGIRLLLDPNDNHSVNAVQYIGSPQQETGTLTIDSTGKVVTRAAGAPWLSLSNRGLLRPGCRIQIPRDTGNWYTVSFVGGSLLVLNRSISDLAGSTAQFSFALQLAPALLGESQPVLLPRGVVIDLDGSSVPSSWRAASFAGSYSPQMDILFTPRGTVVGDALSLGMLHLHFADLTDVMKWKQISGRSQASYTVPTAPVVPADNVGGTSPVVTRDRLITTLATRTGSVSVHYVNAINSTGLSRADDPYSFAETGQVANK